jgi:hypothetical protein
MNSAVFFHKSELSVDEKKINSINIRKAIEPVTFMRLPLLERGGKKSCYFTFL